MSAPILTSADLHAASASEIESQIRKDTAGLDPAEVQTIINLVMKFGPSIYAAILKLFHITPKA